MKTLIAVSTAAALAATGIYHLINIRTATHNVPVRQIISSDRITDSLAQSKAVKIVNPYDHVLIHDTRNITIRVPETLSDEEILAHFVKGFFGGCVFGLERGLLIATKKEITHFEALSNTPVSSHVWSNTELSTHKLPSPHALLFGAFRVVDYQVRSSTNQQPQSGAHSYIDFAFGSDDGFIAGVHRFSMTSANDEVQSEDDRDSTKTVTIEFAHSGCNPKENKPLKPDVLQTLHLWYAMLLFREGVAEVLKAQ